MRFLQRHDAVGDRGRARHLADARLAPAAACARGDARPPRRAGTAARHDGCFRHPRFPRPSRVPPAGAARADGRRAPRRGGRGGARRSAARGHRGRGERLPARLRRRRRGRVTSGSRSAPTGGSRSSSRTTGPDSTGNRSRSGSRTELGEDGMGLAIIRAVADEVEIGATRRAARARGCGSRALCVERGVAIRVEIEDAVEPGQREDARGVRRAGETMRRRPSRSPKPSQDADERTQRRRVEKRDGCEVDDERRAPASSTRRRRSRRSDGAAKASISPCSVTT